MSLVKRWTDKIHLGTVSGVPIRIETSFVLLELGEFPVSRRVPSLKLLQMWFASMCLSQLTLGSIHGVPGYSLFRSDCIRVSSVIGACQRPVQLQWEHSQERCSFSRLYNLV